MQHMIRSGWNPVLDSSREAIAAFAGKGEIALDHVFMYSKLVPLMGAVVGKATGLFAADSFVAYALAVSLWIVAKRMAVAYWGCSRFAAHAFAASVALSTKLAGVMWGYVDYDVYAAFLTAAFSLALSRRGAGQCVLHSLLFALSELVLLGAKSNGIVFALLLLPVFAAAHFRAGRRLAWRVPLAVVVLGVFMNANPILPMAREVLWEARPIVDVTPDFTGNADALGLGYFWRVVYAWVSPRLVPGDPQFYVFGGVGGFGTAFRLALLVSLAAVVAARKNFTTILVVVIFVTSNCLPLKYIGHARYCPQMWAVPMVALFNLAYAPSGFIKRILRSWPRSLPMLRAGVLAVFACSTLLIALRTLAFAKAAMAYEAARQADLAELREAGLGCRLSDRLAGSTAGYTVLNRVRAAGITCKVDSAAEAIDFDANSLLFANEDGLLANGARAQALYLGFQEGPCGWLAILFKAPFVAPRPVFLLRENAL